jgi:uncharacterized protein
VTEQLTIVFVIFLAVFTQSLSGFGSALVSMALLPAVVSIHVATPLVALVVLTIEVFLLIRYRQALNIGAVWRIIVASLAGIPFGILLLSRLNDGTMMTILGIVIAGYAIYALLEAFSNRIQLPKLEHPAWAYGSGLIAGMLGGTYNTSGPPVIIYGNCQRWGTAEFKGNLQGFFVPSSLVIALAHAWNHNLTSEVWQLYLWSFPAMFLGTLAGTSLDRFIHPVTFRRIVLVLLVILGIRLIFA